MTARPPLPRPNRISQIVVNLGYHDAIAREAFLFADLLQAAGFGTTLFAGRTHPRAAAVSRPLAEFVPAEWDAVIHHYSGADGMLPLLSRRETKAILRYHNITPPHFFYGINPDLVAVNREGRARLPELLPLYHEVWAVSQFNLDELRALGLQGGRVLPYVSADPPVGPLPPDGERPPVVLAVGRLAPNKGLPFLLTAFAQLTAAMPAARLTVVGTDAGTELHAARLREQAAALGIAGRVTWAGEVSDPELAEQYRRSSVLAVTSEHEGFCVPLLEAMAAGLPVVAADQPAVREVLGNSGVVVARRDPAVFAAAVHRMLTDRPLRVAVIAAQQRRRAEFALDRLRPRFREGLDAVRRAPEPLVRFRLDTPPEKR